ncbi:DHH family protein [Methanobrevibacter cuticularis]|uniref:DHH family protein n=1 Tax=Methanobrevibacter cuticularis TaxID=47311 RepID=A0A166EDP4_9EURY|nr:DHH family phosphoesterase [Methanobrevibacter cuticularis]KZX16540.1 DHH family protein [Methanobrevibacter cuticularis]
MKKSCPSCKGIGSKVVDTKICDACDGTGYQDIIEVKNHFKGVNNNAKSKFDLEMDQDIPCEVCKGKGTIEVHQKCDICKGTGEINACESCGKIIASDKNYCDECKIKIEEEKMKEKERLEKEKLAKTKVYVLDPLCEMNDLEINSIYKGKITRVEKYGVFVSLNNQVWGLMRTGNPDYNVGENIFVRITEIKPHKREVDMGLATIIGDYEIVKVKKNISRTQIASLDNKSMGKMVRIEGEVIQVQQTSGPTIFTITDETAITWAAAFDEAGVRAYPDVENGDIVEVMGEVNQHSGKVQIESQIIEKLEGEKEEQIRGLIEKALDERAEPEKVDSLAKSEILDKLQPKMRKAAKTIKKAILDGRTVLLRHHADADGICAGVAMEKAVLPLLREMSPSSDAEWHYFRRSPSKAPFYEMEDVVKDLSFALEDLERHGQKLPLIVLLDNGSTEEDVLALMKAKIYDIEIVVIDHHFPGEVIDGIVEVDEFVDVHVNPYLVGGDSQITAGALAVEVANIINPEIKDTIKHLPGIAALGDHAQSDEAEQYITIAGEKGYDRNDLDKIAACVDFEAYYLRFMNGRGIMDTILGVDNLDKHERLVDALFKEYEKKVAIQLKATLPNLKESRLDNGIFFNILDVEKFAHRFTFPAPGKTCGFVHDSVVKKYGEDKPILTLSYGPDFGVIRATEAVNKIFGFNLNEIVWKLANEIPEAGIDGGGHECAGSLKFVEGLSKKVLNSFLEEVASMKK